MRKLRKKVFSRSVERIARVDRAMRALVVYHAKADPSVIDVSVAFSTVTWCAREITLNSALLIDARVRSMTYPPNLSSKGRVQSLFGGEEK